MKDLQSAHKYSPTPLHYLTFILQHLSDELLIHEAGISLSHVRIMGGLHGAVPRSQMQVAAGLHQTEANVSRQLQAMKREGLVSIKRNKKDGRQRDVLLTSKGARKYKQAEKILNQQHKKLLSSLAKRQSKSFENSVKELLRAL